MKKKDNIEENYKLLETLGFKRKGVEYKEDPTSGWMEKKAIVGGFNAKLCYDGGFSLLDIQTIEVFSGNKQYETIWTGTFKELLKKNEQYGV